MRVSGTDSTVKSGLVAVQIGTALLVKVVSVSGRDSTVKSGLVAVQIGTALLVKASVFRYLM
jgi:hypothetical protein